MQAVPGHAERILVPHCHTGDLAISDPEVASAPAAAVALAVVPLYVHSDDAAAAPPPHDSAHCQLCTSFGKGKGMC